MITSNYEEWLASNSQSFTLFGGASIPIFGQVLTFKEETIVRSISVWLSSQSSNVESFSYAAYLWEWDGLKKGKKIWNSGLLTSPLFSDNTSWKEVITNINSNNGILLQPNIKYSFCLVSSKIILDNNGVPLDYNSNNFRVAHVPVDTLDETSYVVLHTGSDSFKVGEHNPLDTNWVPLPSNLTIRVMGTLLSTLTPLTMFISSSKISERVSQLVFTSNYETNDFNSNDISISGGNLLDFSGSGKEYKAIFVADDFGEFTIQVLAGKFSSGGSFNQESNIHVINKNTPIYVSEKKTVKEHNRMITNILKMRKNWEVLSILTQFRTLYVNNTISVSEQKDFLSFLIENGQYKRGVLLKILESLENHPLSQTSIDIHHGIVENEKLTTISQLLKDSLGDKIIDNYLVNQDLGVFKDLAYLRHYLRTDFNYLDSSLVLLDKESIILDVTKNFMVYFDLADINSGDVLVNGTSRYVYDRTKSKQEFIRSAYEIMKQNEEVLAFVVNYTDNSQEIPADVVWKGNIVGAFGQEETTTTTGQQLFAIENLDLLGHLTGKKGNLYTENEQNVSTLENIIASIILKPDNLIDVSSTSLQSLFNSFNNGMKSIVNSLHQICSQENAMTDFRTLDNSHENSSGLFLKNMRLTFINRGLLRLLRDQGYFKDTYYGLQVGIDNSSDHLTQDPEYNKIKKSQLKNQMRMSIINNIAEANSRKIELSTHNNISESIRLSSLNKEVITNYNLWNHRDKLGHVGYDNPYYCTHMSFKEKVSLTDISFWMRPVYSVSQPYSVEYCLYIWEFDNESKMIGKKIWNSELLKTPTFSNSDSFVELKINNIQVNLLEANLTYIICYVGSSAIKGIESLGKKKESFWVANTHCEHKSENVGSSYNNYKSQKFDIGSHNPPSKFIFDNSSELINKITYYKFNSS